MYHIGTNQNKPIVVPYIFFPLYYILFLLVLNMYVHIQLYHLEGNFYVILLDDNHFFIGATSFKAHAVALLGMHPVNIHTKKTWFECTPVCFEYFLKVKYKLILRFFSS